MDKFLKKVNDDENYQYNPTISTKNCAHFVSLQPNGTKKMVILTEIPKLEIEAENLNEIMKKF